MDSEKRFSVCEVLILTPVILAIIGLFLLPTVFYALPQTEPPLLQAPSLLMSCSTEGSSTTVNYFGGVCREALTSLQMCFSGTTSPPPPLNIPSLIDQQAGEESATTLVNGLSLLNPSPQCREAILPFLCLSIFPLCDSNNCLRTILREDCLELREDICADEWVIAVRFLGNGVLPVCEDLLDVPEDCIGDSTSCSSNPATPINATSHLSDQTTPNQDNRLTCSEGFFFDENVTNICRPICGEFNPLPLAAKVLEIYVAVPLCYIASATLLVLALTVQRDTLQQQQATMTTQLNSRTVQTPGAVADKVAEQEKLLEHRQLEMEQLKANCQRLQAQLQSLNDVCQERDMLKQKVDQLESSHAQIAAEAQQSSAALSHMGSLQEDLQKVRMAAAQEKAELQTQHNGEVQELKKGLAEVEGLREHSAQLEKQNKELMAQVEKSSKVEEQVKSLNLQLEAEKSGKEELQKELESRPKVLPNGPVEGLSNGPAQQQSSEIEDRLVKEVTDLEKKLDDLKAKNDELTECLWQAKQEAGVTEKTWDEKLRQLQDKMEQDVSSAKTEALQGAYSDHRTLLKQLFPEASVEECGEGKQEQWLEEFESKAQAILASRKVENDSLKQKIEALEKQNEESTGETLQFRQTLEKTMSILAELQTKVDKSDVDHQQALQEKETALHTERASAQRLQTELGKEKAVLSEVREELGKEKALVSQVRKELDQAKEQLDQERALIEQVKEELREEKEAASKEQATQVEGQGEELTRLEERLKQLEQSRTDMEKEVTELQGELKGKEEAQEALEQRVAAESKLKEDALKQCDELEVTKKDLADRLEIMKNSNRELNARLSNLMPTQSPTDSEV